MQIKTKLPWWLKIIVKIFFSRLPVAYSVWRKIGLFRHGSMDKVEYAYNVYIRHFDQLVNRKSPVILELGPGDSLSTALFSLAHDCSKTYMIDVGDYANRELENYRLVKDYVSKIIVNDKLSELQITSINEMLNYCNAEYYTDGLESLKKIADKSVDLVFSQAVLEHIPKNEFYETFIEIHRILKDDGICSHEIDLRDHLANGLNNLRFSEKFWESKFMSSSGFYTNRLRKSEMIEYFKKSGFNVTIMNETRWKKVPIDRSKLYGPFKSYSDDDLIISTFSVLLSPLAL